MNKNSTSAYDIDRYENDFHDHPDYFKEPRVSKISRSTLDLRASSIVLTKSHIGRTRHIDNIDSKFPSSRRILRQGFEFLEPVSFKGKSLEPGLNFICFQNDPSRLFFILTHPDWMGKSNFGGDERSFGNQKLTALSIFWGLFCTAR